MSIRQCTLTDNIAHEGGGIRVEGLGSSLLLVDSTVSGNHAAIGGGLSVANGSTAIIESSTISDNFATQDPTLTSDFDGGGLFVFDANVKIHGSTISQNTGRNWAGGLLAARGSDLTVENSIVANNYLENFPKEKSVDLADRSQGNARSDSRITIQSSIFGTVNSEYIDGGNNLIGVDPRLGPLADNGGPTKSHALLVGSPAIDAGATTNRRPKKDFDQRGEPFIRVVDGDDDGTATADIGAFEFQNR